MCEDRLVVVDVTIFIVIEGDALHLISQWWQHGRELTSFLVGGYIYIIGVGVGRIIRFEAGSISRTLNTVGSTLYRQVNRSIIFVAVVISDIVERALALASETQFDGSLAQSVDAFSESERFVHVGESAIHTSCDVYQCRVDEVGNLCFLEIIFPAVYRERGEAVSVHVTFDEVFTDGDRNLVLAVSIAAHPFLRLHQIAVDHELHAINGDIGVQIGNLTSQWERRHIAEVVTIQCQRTVADESVARCWIKLMNATSRQKGISRTAAYERDTADDVFTGGIGHGIT